VPSQAYCDVDVSEPTLLCARDHGNGSIAEVFRQPDGWYLARERRTTAADAGQYLGDLETEHLALSVADALAHPGCSGIRCGCWATRQTAGLVEG
jgi:hypothetical protein